MPPKRKAMKEMESGDDSDDYRKKRDKNNLAVKRSRVKSKIKTQETLERVNQLRKENTALEEKVKTLTKELDFLKKLFLAHAGNNTTSQFEDVDLDRLLAESTEEESETPSRNSNNKKKK